VPELGQQLFVELLDAPGADAALSDSRLIDGSSPSDWPISFGVIPGPTSTPRLRVRLYRLDETAADGSPQGTALIDETATLPGLATGVTTVEMTLAGACFGVAPDVVAHLACDPTTGQLAAEPTLAPLADVAALPKPGSWGPATMVPCPSPPPSGMSCVPGGVALLGSPQFFPAGTALDSVPEQLVELSPFAIDVDEVTVGQVRSLVLSSGLSAPLIGDPDANATPPACTYLGDNDASHDDYPVNCVSWGQAEKACALLGKRLPTEAEWEYVASNLEQKTPFPWGADTKACAYAWVGRGRPSVLSENTECSASGPFGPTPQGSSMDVTELGVRNLGGNVDEWVADTFEPYTGPCWQPESTLLVAPPPCMVPSPKPTHSIRGGNWSDAPAAAHAYTRNASLNGDEGGVTTGFRCASSM
jgi:formylglycine-generating enzyme required for sulfatase activity